MLSKIFKSKQKKDCKKGDFFAILKGKYAGEFWILMSDTEKNFNFLSLPDMKKIEVPKEKIDIGINLKIMDFIQNIPNKVFKVCEIQYKNIKSK